MNLSWVKTIAELVETHRKKSGLSQKELAQLAGVGKTAVFDIEHAKATVQLATLMKVFDALNIQISFSSPLLKEIGEKNEKS